VAARFFDLKKLRSRSKQLRFASSGRIAFKGRRCRRHRCDSPSREFDGVRRFCFSHAARSLQPRLNLRIFSCLKQHSPLQTDEMHSRNLLRVATGASRVNICSDVFECRDRNRHNERFLREKSLQMLTLDAPVATLRRFRECISSVCKGECVLDKKKIRRLSLGWSDLAAWLKQNLRTPSNSRDGRIASVPATPSTFEGYAGRNSRNGAGLLLDLSFLRSKKRAATVGVLVWD